MARITKGRLLQAMRDNGGTVARIAEQFGCTRQTIYNNIRRFELERELEDTREAIFEIAEGNIFNAVRGGSLEMSRFVVTHMPHQRRWSSRHELTGRDGMALFSEETRKLLDEMGITMTDVAREFETLVRAAAGVEQG